MFNFEWAGAFDEVITALNAGNSRFKPNDTSVFEKYLDAINSNLSFMGKAIEISGDEIVVKEVEDE